MRKQKKRDPSIILAAVVTFLVQYCLTLGVKKIENTFDKQKHRDREKIVYAVQVKSSVLDNFFSIFKIGG